MKTQHIYVFIMTVAALLSGCGKTAVNKNQYALAIPKEITKQPKPLNAILEVRTFTINSKFSSRQLVYRVSEFRYVPDYYDEFFVPPAVMITEATRNWLADAGLFTMVLEPGSSMSPSYVLEGNIVECYADVRDKAAPVAVLKIQLFLMKRTNSVDSLVWSHIYDTKERMKDTSGESFVGAFNRCLQTVLENMQADISGLQ
jgi:cholesterol transport system auxiliary component